MPPDELLEIYALSIAAYALVFVLGTLFGSFANVCIYRLPPSEEHPRGQSIVSPGSRCGHCGQPVRWYDNIPLLSYLLLRGQCRDCGQPFSARYLFVEAAVGMLFVAFYHFAVGLAFLDDPLSFRMTRFLILAAFGLAMVVIAFIDLDHKLILDRVTYPAIPVFYGLGLLLPENEWQHGLIGAAVGYLTIRLIADGYYFLTKREGLGYGDGKLLAVVGALFGWQGVVIALFFGSILGSVIGTAALIIARRGQDPSAEAEATGQGAGSADEGPAGDLPPEADSGVTSEGGAADAGEEPGGEEEIVPLRHAEVPFGPFLAIGALAYVFVQPWLRISFALLWGTSGPVM